MCVIFQFFIHEWREKNAKGAKTRQAASAKFQFLWNPENWCKLFARLSVLRGAKKERNGTEKSQSLFFFEWKYFVVLVKYSKLQTTNYQSLFGEETESVKFMGLSDKLSVLGKKRILLIYDSRGNRNSVDCIVHAHAPSRAFNVKWQIMLVMSQVKRLSVRLS